ncbi:MAG: hypothetical protein U0354_00550 [Candidatus Sericytochromatia bacterium]
MALDSIGSDLNKINVKPVSPIGELQNTNNVSKTLENTNTTPQINNDGANVNSNKGKIPASGSIFDTNNKNSAAEKVINQFSGDKKQLQSFLTALENINLNDGISNESDDVMNEILNLGFDITMQNGKITILDGDGNEIKPEDFNAIKDNLKNTLKRAINNAGSVAGVLASSSLKASSVPPKLSAAQEESVLSVFKDMGETEKHIQTVSNPLKADLEVKIKEYESKVAEAENQSKKIDNSISQIIALKSQAEALIEKGKKQPLTETEKKQLLSISSTIDIKQKEMQSYQKGNELLLQQVDQVYAQFSDNLSASEKSTKDAMQTALKAKISGQALDVRQNFLASISEDIYKLTSNMSPEEVQKLSTDTGARVKLLASTNKILDKMASATKLSDLSPQDIETLSKFKIKAVEENGKLEFYYQANDKSNPVKLSKEDLKQMRVDLNNVVSSDALFTLARASGQISLAYDKGLTTPPKDKVEPNSSSTNVQAKKDKKDKNNSDSDNSVKESPKQKLSTGDENFIQKQAKKIEIKAMDENIDKKREQEKYHEKQIRHIHDTRQQINKELNARRTAEGDQKYQENQKIIHNKK